MAMYSLKKQVVLWSSVILLSLATITGVITYWQTFHNTNGMQDENLKNIATLILQQYPLTNLSNQLSIHRQFSTTDNEGLVITNIYQKSSVTNALPKDIAEIPQGFSLKDDKQKTWQIYRADSAHWAVIVRQDNSFQNNKAKEQALQAVLPILVGIVLLVVILPLLFAMSLKGITQVSQEINHRHQYDLRPILNQNIPDEILPMLTAINRLFTQLKDAFDQQQRFIANVSHELRSPLTAMSLQVQRIQRLNMTKDLYPELDKLAIGVKRNQDLVEQLLALARIEANEYQQQPVSLEKIIEDVLLILLPIADEKNIQFDVELAQNIQIKSDETALFILIKNLLQNAILYSPNDSPVHIVTMTTKQWQTHIPSHTKTILQPTAIRPNDNVLQIINVGKGIHPDDYQRVFEPFIRLNDVDSNYKQIKGSGLGLMTVKSICEKAKIGLFFSPISADFHASDTKSMACGLCVTLVFSNDKTIYQSLYYDQV